MKQKQNLFSLNNLTNILSKETDFTVSKPERAKTAATNASAFGRKKLSITSNSVGRENYNSQ